MFNFVMNCLMFKEMLCDSELNMCIYANASVSVYYKYFLLTHLIYFMQMHCVYLQMYCFLNEIIAV